MKHTEKYRVYYYDTDRNFNIKLFNLARYLQETALIAFEKHEEANREMRDKKLAFFLSRISLRFEGEIRKFDDISIETWALPPKTATFTRNYRVFNETEGKCAVKVASSWVLVNTETNGIVRPRALSEHFIAISTDSEELGFSAVRRIKIPDGVTADKTPLLEKEVCYSDIDENQHMNNAVYFNVIQDALYKAEISGLKLTALDISFDKGAPEGAKITVSGTKIPGETQTEVHQTEIYQTKVHQTDVYQTEVYLQGIFGGECCFNARAELTSAKDFNI